MPDQEFCWLCQRLLAWREMENSRRQRVRPSRPRLSLRDLGLHSGEKYTNAADSPRIAVIYNGLRGRGQWLPFRKGDPEGNRWVDNEPLLIEWSPANVAWFLDNSGRRESGMPVVRNAQLYLTPGVTWTAVANHVAMKARYQDACVFDADSMRLTPDERVLRPLALLALFNSDLVSFMKMRFARNTAKWEIGDLRALPLAMPTPAEEERLTTLAGRAIEAKRLTFTDEQQSHELAAYSRELAAELTAHAPGYLKPHPQRPLLDTAHACLKVIELVVNWEAEKLYGVEGLGPFDEF